jgi:lipoate-protein ligase A
MIEILSIISSLSFNPYSNLGLEEYLLNICKSNEAILYLWQNKNTVVIGKNQNCWKECRVSELESDGGYLARRLSGGGAVYHDIGNLNYTYICPKEYYNIQKQTESVINAVRRFGIDAKITGRNDLTINGRKFSGNAYYKTAENCYQHGTIMIASDSNAVEKYLSVSKAKLESHNVDSVRSRICSLREFDNSVQIEDVKRNLIDAFSDSLSITAARFSDNRIKNTELDKLISKYMSADWKYNSRRDFSFTLNNRFAWGGIEIGFEISGSEIETVSLYTDSMNTSYFDRLRKSLIHSCFNYSSISITLAKANDDNESQIRKDILSLLKESM